MNIFSRDWFIAYQQSFKQLSRTRQVLVVLGVIVIIAGILWFLFGRSNGGQETQVVTFGNLTQTVSVTGVVKPVTDVSLSFEHSGKIVAAPGKVGDPVAQGTLLVALDTGTLQADLQAALADLASRRAEASNTSVNLEEIKNQQEALVKNAYRTLLSDDLTVVPQSTSYDVTPPIVTGLYNGSEGVYKIRVIQEAQGNAEYELRTFDLETTPPVEILDSEPTALGTRGLFISFPDDIAAYRDTIWYVTIPNTKSSSYLSNYNAYQQARRTADREIAAAEAQIAKRSSGLTVAEANIERAEAEVARIQKQIAERRLVSPISGIITTHEARVGEIVTAGTELVAVISNEAFQIEANIPEINIGNVVIGNSVALTFDALPGEKFTGKVVSIEPSENLVDGVVNYKIKIALDETDPRLKSGLTANLVISTATKPNVLMISEGALYFEADQAFVDKQLANGGQEKTNVTIGLRGDEGMVEVLSGLATGDVVFLQK